jgi:hypothetical protein
MKKPEANMRQVMFKDLFRTAMETVREKLWRGNSTTGGWNGRGVRRRARALARKIAREALREELGNS